MRNQPILVLHLALVGFLALLAPSSGAQEREPAPVPQAKPAVETVAGVEFSITRSPRNRLATFMGGAHGRSILAPDRAALTPESRALSFVGTYGSAFGLRGDRDVRISRKETDGLGIDHVRMRQVRSGIRVTGGELIVHMRGSRILAVNGKTLEDLDGVNLDPLVTSLDAISIARQYLTRTLNAPDTELSEPVLEIFNRGLLEGRSFPSRLAWFVEARELGLREFLWIDARSRTVLLNFSQLTDAKNRAIHDANSTSALPGTLIRSEGQAESGTAASADAVKAYDFSGDTYDYFLTQHGRDSFDGAGGQLISTIRFCPSPSSCPYSNAFWNGQQMVYGAGFSSADDVVAHELTHAVTERTANLYYYMQSGALNESFSDIFGEAVDLGNGAGNDGLGVRWQLGEDLPGTGAIRNLLTPTAFSDPGKMSDPEFKCDPDPVAQDSGGVHTNSGVPNHAFALMVDGGFYNGFTIAPLDANPATSLLKAGKIQYRALTLYLVSASDFLDNYNALQQACSDLIGTSGITAGNCVEVKKALDAVQMSSGWNCSPAQAPPPALCSAGSSVQNVFLDNFESGLGNWTIQTLSGATGTWARASAPTFPSLDPVVFATSGVDSLWGYDQPQTSDATIRLSSNLIIPANARLNFNHSYGFEDSSGTFYDGGTVEYSVNGGASWAGLAPLHLGGASYGGSIASAFGNPLAGQPAFVGDSFGYTASQYNLSSLAGQTQVRFRFRIGADSLIDDYGWFIDDFRVYQCVTNPTMSINDVAVTEGNAGSQSAMFTVSLSASSTLPVAVNYATANNSAIAGTDYQSTSGTLTIPAGASSGTITVGVLGDLTYETDETFLVNLSAATNATISDPQGVGTITNDDSTPSLTINDPSVTEGNSGTTNHNFTVSLSAISALPVTVNYATADGSALAGTDYQNTAGTLTIPAGSLSGTITIPVLGDTTNEPNETYFVNLSSPAGATIADAQGVGTIVNDDDPVAPVPPSLTINDPSLNEGNSGAANHNFTVSLSSSSTLAVTVGYATLSGSALASSDYQPTSGTLTIPAGSTSGTITVPVIGDLVDESAETYFVNLSGATNASISDAQGVGTIVNDDGPLMQIEALAATPTLVARGACSAVSWSVTGTGSVTLNGTVVAANGSISACPSQSTNYTLVGSNAFGSASRTVTVSVNDGAANLGIPTVTSPGGGQVVEVTGVGFAWSAVGAAGGYDIRVVDGPTGTILFSGSLQGAGATSTLVSLGAGSYQFAVRACAGGFTASQCGPYGTVYFTVSPAGPGDAPTVTLPAQGAILTSSTQTLSWTAVTPHPALSGLAYEVLLRDLTAGTTALQITVPSPALSTIFTMKSSTQYELKVRACQASCGPYSPAVTFALTLPPVPVSAPSGVTCSVSGGNNLTCNWGAVTNADAYQIQVVQAPPAGPGGGALTVAAKQVSATSVTLPVPLGEATVFIAACNGNGCGPNATTLIAAVGPNPSQANIGTPMAGTVVSGPGLLFTWNRVPGDNGSNTSYRLFVQDLSRQATALDVFTTSNFYSAFFKAEGARYDALVVSNPGLPSQATGPAQGFNVAGSSATAPTLVSPAHNSTVGAGNVGLGWSPAPGATLYEYFVAVLGQGVASARGVTFGLVAQVPLSATGGETMYSGIVRACPAGATCVSGSEGGWGPWSNAPGGPGVTNFTVRP